MHILQYMHVSDCRLSFSLPYNITGTLLLINNYILHRKVNFTRNKVDIVNLNLHMWAQMASRTVQHINSD